MMQFTSAQQVAFKAWLTANASGLSDQDAANLGNTLASPNFFCWRTSISRQDLYTTTSDLATVWDWAVYKAQSVTEQGAWVQMFMGDSAPFNNVNIRLGIHAIFGGANGQRNHCFAVGRRKTTNVEKLFATPITGAPVNSGNDNVVNNQGTATNPSQFGIGANNTTLEGEVTAQQVAEARA